jgi:hypothetical protein
MVVTEEQARDLWCPFVRSTRGASVATNRDSDGSIVKRVTCVGSACMMWRQEVPSPERNEAAKTQGIRGYCGLAGVPWEDGRGAVTMVKR